MKLSLSSQRSSSQIRRSPFSLGTAVTRNGLDLAENAFQVHSVDAKGEIVVPHLTLGWLIAFFAELPSGS